MATPPTFGRRGLKGAPSLGPKPAPSSPRRMRSNMVAVGAVGLFGLGLTGAVAYQEYRCRTPGLDEPDTRPNWCFSHNDDYSGGGHGWGFAAGGGSGIGHASFGGFGAAGAGHGGGS